MRARWSVLLLAALVGTAHAQGGPTAILDRVQLNPRRPIDFHAIALPESVFVGQQATYQVAVLLSPEARSRLRRNPEFLPPELRGLLAYELGTPVRVPPRSYGGSVFEAHVFQRALFPVAAGRQVVPAPQLTYAMPQSSSYFSREERFVVNAESAEFFVKPLPITGRPDDFGGAVGVFKSSVHIDTSSARVGDPLVLTLRVQGTGNVKLLPRPTIEIGWASAVPGSERITVDSSGALVRGAKEFDWILTPALDGRVSVPVLRYSYFDPYAARYAVAESAPVDLSVRRGALAAADEGEKSAELLPMRVATGATAQTVQWNGRGRPPAAWIIWILLALVAPLPAIWWARRPRDAARRRGKETAQRSGQDVGRAAAGSRTARDVERDVARSTRRDLLAALAARFDQAPQSLVSRMYVARVLRRARRHARHDAQRDCAPRTARRTRLRRRRRESHDRKCSHDKRLDHSCVAPSCFVALRRRRCRAVDESGARRLPCCCLLSACLASPAVPLGCAPSRSRRRLRRSRRRAQPTSVAPSPKLKTALPCWSSNIRAIRTC